MSSPRPSTRSIREAATSSTSSRSRPPAARALRVARGSPAPRPLARSTRAGRDRCAAPPGARRRPPRSVLLQPRPHGRRARDRRRSRRPSSRPTPRTPLCRPPPLADRYPRRGLADPPSRTRPHHAHRQDHPNRRFAPVPRTPPTPRPLSHRRRVTAGLSSSNYDAGRA